MIRFKGLTMFKTGQIVTFKKPATLAERSEHFVVVEMRGERVLVQDAHADYIRTIPPQFVYLVSDMVAMPDLQETIALRISIARIAQSLGVDNELRVTGKPYEELAQLAQSQDRGWNSLACLANDAIHTHYTLKA